MIGSFCAIFVWLELIFNMLAERLHEDLEGDPRQLHLDYKSSVVHVDYFHANFPFTLLGLFSVPSNLVPLQ